MKTLEAISTILFWSLLVCLGAQLVLSIKAGKKFRAECDREAARRREERLADFDARIYKLENPEPQVEGA